MKIELIAFDGCPHADAARTNALAAIAAAGLALPLLEWDRESPEAPDYVRRYPSPSILVDGRDVTRDGSRDADETGTDFACCAAAGAPSVATILAALSVT